MRLPGRIRFIGNNSNPQLLQLIAVSGQAFINEMGYTARLEEIARPERARDCSGFRLVRDCGLLRGDALEEISYL